MRVGEANMATLYYFLNFYGKLNSKNIVYLKWKIEDFPGGPVVKNPPSNAEDMDLIPGQGTKIPHTPGQLSPSCATSREVHAPQLLSPRALEPTLHKRSPHRLRLEKARVLQ